jgi:hypothetical protein
MLPVQEPDYEAMWHKVWPDVGSFVRVSADDLKKFAKAVSTPPVALEQLVALVRADEREQGQKWFAAVTAQHKQLILAEREACAKVCDGLPTPGRISLDNESLWEAATLDCADAIRARGNT